MSTKRERLLDWVRNGNPKDLPVPMSWKKVRGSHAGTPVYAVLGGFHMSGASRRRITDVIGGLNKLGVSRVAPCHCSGNKTRSLMKEAFPDGYLPSDVGARIVFHPG